MITKAELEKMVEDAFENCDEVISNIRKALTQKAEE